VAVTLHTPTAPIFPVGGWTPGTPTPTAPIFPAGGWTFEQSRPTAPRRDTTTITGVRVRARPNLSAWIRSGPLLDPVRSGHQAGLAVRCPAIGRGWHAGWRFLAGRRRAEIRSRRFDQKFKVLLPASPPPIPSCKCVTSLRPRARGDSAAGSSRSSTRRVESTRAPPLARVAAARRRRYRRSRRPPPPPLAPRAATAAAAAARRPRVASVARGIAATAAARWMPRRASWHDATRQEPL
jgi:hypothetical protein